MDSLSVTLLFSLGIFFIFLEVILYSFFIIWFGIAFLVVAIIEFFFPLPSIWVQLSLVIVIAVILFLVFYKPLKSFVNKSQNFSKFFLFFFIFETSSDCDYTYKYIHANYNQSIFKQRSKLTQTHKIFMYF